MIQLNNGNLDKNKIWMNVIITNINTKTIHRMENSYLKKFKMTHIPRMYLLKIDLQEIIKDIQKNLIIQINNMNTEKKRTVKISLIMNKIIKTIK